jgi:2'-5' RNA ligase
MSAAARRLFFALWPGDAVRQALFHWQTHHLPRGVRWQHRADLHVTLHFLGQVEASRLAALRQLGAATRGDGFTLILDQVGYWPRPQILWAGPTTVPAALIALHERLGAGLREQGFATERRSYRPHVTLARKVRRRLGPAPLAPVAWRVDEWALVESRPGPAPRYRPIGRWPLG